MSLTENIHEYIMRLITTRIITILFITLVALWLVVQALYNYSVVVPETTPVAVDSNVDLTLQNIKYTKTEEGKPLWTLIAKSADQLEDGIILVKNVQMFFFDQENGDLVLTADRGKLTPKNGLVSVSSNVVVINSSGQTLQTDFLEQGKNGNILQTDEEVHISTDEYIVTGKGMQIDVVKRTLVLFSDVKAQFGNIENNNAPLSPL
jgi:LPS export ABC transporter protein LptC